MKDYLQETRLLDFNHPAIQQLIADRQWQNLSEQQQILQAYNFVRDEIPFGFNVNDTLSASTILQEGLGQCNTKTILFMALLRGLNIPCRLHGFTIDKQLQAGIMNDDVYEAMPDEIVHTCSRSLFQSALVQHGGAYSRPALPHRATAQVCRPNGYVLRLRGRNAKPAAAASLLERQQ